MNTTKHFDMLESTLAVEPLALLGQLLDEAPVWKRPCFNGVPLKWSTVDGVRHHARTYSNGCLGSAFPRN